MEDEVGHGVGVGSGVAFCCKVEQCAEREGVCAGK